MKTRTVAVATAAGLAAAMWLVPGSASAIGGLADQIPSVAVWSAKCYFVTHKQIDPIGDYGHVPSMHLHTFAGHDNPDASQTPADLRQTTALCNSPDLSNQDPNDPTLGVVPDLSSYWAPTLFSTNLPTVEPIAPAYVLAYYRNSGIDPDKMEAFPENYSTVAGDKTATLDKPQATDHVEWSCVAHDDPAGPNEINFGATIPASCPRYLGSPDNPFYLRLVVYFPDCVDMEHVILRNGQWVSDYQEYQEELPAPEQDADHGITHHCAPAEGRTVTPIPQVQVGFRWPLTAAEGLTSTPGVSSAWDLTSLKVSSDDVTHNQAHGVSAHIDFMSGWSDAALSKLMHTCFWSSAHHTGGVADPGIGPNHCGYVADPGYN